MVTAIIVAFVVVIHVQCLVSVYLSLVKKKKLLTELALLDVGIGKIIGKFCHFHLCELHNGTNIVTRVLLVHADPYRVSNFFSFGERNVSK